WCSLPSSASTRKRRGANAHLHLENEVHLERVVETTRTSAAAVLSFADAVEHALPALGRTKTSLYCRLLFVIPHVADRPLAARADRRLRHGTGGRTRVESQFRIRAYPTPDRCLRRFPLRIH